MQDGWWMHNAQQETIQYIMVFSIYTRRASEYRFFFLESCQ